jgi:hypothetical protein
MTEDTNFRSTIVPKSDQLNYDDVMHGPINVLITNVSRGSTEQPVIISIEGFQPFKPCKGMRRVLISGWGVQGKDWVGKQMTLFGDPEVKWAGVKVGGIKISHMSHIPEPLTLLLTVSRGRRSSFTVNIFKTRADECREWLKNNKITLETAEKSIGKKLDLATGADFSIIGKLVGKK